LRASPPDGGWAAATVAGLLVVFGIVAWQRRSTRQSPRSLRRCAARRIRQAVDRGPAFDNMGGDADKAYFADERRRTSSPTCKVAGLVVIARNSTFRY
jgi:hypothetical protein